MYKKVFLFIGLFLLIVIPIYMGVMNSFSINKHPSSMEKEKEISPIENEVVAVDQRAATERLMPKTITLSFAGDCTLGTDPSFSYKNSFPYRFEKNGKDFSYFFSGVKEIFERDDFTLVNLETTFTTAKKKANKKFCFKGDPSYVNILKEGSVEAVNISNNHIYDFLQQGFNDTLHTLEEANILYSGEGNIAFYSVENIMIASLGYTGWNTSIKEQLKNDILNARKKANIVVVSFHWGQERSFYPNKTQTILGRYAIDQGADIVVGHHPHVIQGIDEYKGKYIVYSLGNFSFGGNRNPSDKDTFIFQLDVVFENNEMVSSSPKIIPCSISSSKDVNDYRPIILKGRDKERVLNRIYEYSSKLKYGIKK